MKSFLLSYAHIDLAKFCKRRGEDKFARSGLHGMLVSMAIADAQRKIEGWTYSMFKMKNGCTKGFKVLQWLDDV